MLSRYDRPVSHRDRIQSIVLTRAAWALTAIRCLSANARDDRRLLQVRTDTTAQTRRPKPPARKSTEGKQP
jgi:hypothetical protein